MLSAAHRIAYNLVVILTNMGDTTKGGENLTLYRTELMVIPQDRQMIYVCFYIFVISIYCFIFVIWMVH